MVQAPAKSRSDVEILIEKFNEWAEDRILDLKETSGNPFFSDDTRFEACGGIKWLESAERNIKSLAEGIANERRKI